MANRVVRLVFSGDSRGAVRAMRDVADTSDRTSRKVSEDNRRTAGSFDHVHGAMSRTRGGISMLAGAAGLGGLAFGIKDVVTAGLKLQEQQATLQQGLRQTGLSSRAAAQATQHMTDVADKAATRGGFSTPENLQVMTQLIRATGSQATAMRDMALATNIARGAHKDYFQVAKAVALAEQGRTTGFARLGIVIPKVTAAQDALKLSTGKHTVAQLMAAKASDAAASKLNTLAVLSQKYGGATSAYMHTAQGSISDAQHAIDISMAKVGVALLPTVAKIATWLGDNLPKAIAKTIAVVKQVINWFKQHKQVTDTLVTALKFLVPAIVGILIIEKVTGPFRRAFSAVSAFAGAARTAFGVARTLATSLGLIPAKAAAAGTAVEAASAKAAIAQGRFAGLAGVVARLAPILGALGLAGAVVGAQALVGKALGGNSPTGARPANPSGRLSGGQRLASGGGGILPLLKSLNPFASGGLVGGYGQGDSVPARLTPGEFVMNKAAVQRAGVNNLDSLNAGAHTAGAAGGGTTAAQITIPVKLYLGQRILAEEVVHYLHRNAALG